MSALSPSAPALIALPDGWAGRWAPPAEESEDCQWPVLSVTSNGDC